MSPSAAARLPAAGCPLEGQPVGPRQGTRTRADAAEQPPSQQTKQHAAHTIDVCRGACVGPAAAAPSSRFPPRPQAHPRASRALAAAPCRATRGAPAEITLSRGRIGPQAPPAAPARGHAAACSRSGAAPRQQAPAPTWILRHAAPDAKVRLVRPVVFGCTAWALAAAAGVGVVTVRPASALCRGRCAPPSRAAPGEVGGSAAAAQRRAGGRGAARCGRFGAPRQRQVSAPA